MIYPFPDISKLGQEMEQLPPRKAIRVDIRTVIFLNGMRMEI